MAARRVLWAGNQLQMTALDCVWSLSPSKDKTPLTTGHKRTKDTPLKTRWKEEEEPFWSLKSSHLTVAEKVLSCFLSPSHFINTNRVSE